MKNAKVTLKQVADKAKVSLASASMILNDKPGVSFSPETTQRVLQAAEELEYQWAGMKRKDGVFCHKTIAIISPTITGPYYATLVQAVEQSAAQSGFDVICYNTYRNPERELRGIQSLAASDIAGIIFTFIPTHYPLLEQLSQTLPVVVIGNRNEQMQIDMVETDNYGAGVIMARHILQLGHRTIAYIGGGSDWWGYPSVPRLDGVRDTLQKECPSAELVVKFRHYASELEPDAIFTARRLGYEQMKEVLTLPRITGIIAQSDVIAMGVLDAIAEEGRKVPEEYSVCACDNIFFSSLPGVSLTTVDQHMLSKGHDAFHLLLEKINHTASAGTAPVSITRVEYPSELIARGSTASPAK